MNFWYFRGISLVMGIGYLSLVFVGIIRNLCPWRRRFSRFPDNFWMNFWKTGNLNFWALNQVQWQKLSGKNTQYIEIGQYQPNSRKCPDSRSQENWNLEILGSKSISVTKTEWKWYPICWNWPKTANSRDFPDFQIISGWISGKLEIWISEH